eukprot:6172316-Pleurochrysis_carterae.AAC.1
MALLLVPAPHGPQREGGTSSALAPPRAAARTLPTNGELPPAATSKLVALKPYTGEAGRCKADAAVLQPLTTQTLQRCECLMEPAAGPVPTLASMMAEPGYGDAVWAATGTLAAKGKIPSSLVAPRQQLECGLLAKKAGMSITTAPLARTSSAGSVDSARPLTANTTRTSHVRPCRRRRRRARRRRCHQCAAPAPPTQPACGR